MTLPNARRGARDALLLGALLLGALLLCACATTRPSAAAGSRLDSIEAPKDPLDGTLHVRVEVPTEPGVCVVYREHTVLDGRDVAITQAPADNCGFPPAQLHIRNELDRSVVIESFDLRRGDADSGTTTDLDPDFAGIAPGEERSFPLQVRDGEHQVLVHVLSGDARTTSDASFVIPPPRIDTIDRP